MALYAITSFDHLKKNELYTIDVDREHYYYIGVFDGYKMYHWPRVFSAKFKHLEKTFKKYDPVVGTRIYSRDPNYYFDAVKVYKRVVSLDEQREAYQEAFERRALRQILESILGHPV